MHTKPAGLLLKVCVAPDRRLQPRDLCDRLCSRPALKIWQQACKVTGGGSGGGSGGGTDRALQARVSPLPARTRRFTFFLQRFTIARMGTIWCCPKLGGGSEHLIFKQPGLVRVVFKQARADDKETVGEGSLGRAGT